MSDFEDEPTNETRPISIGAQLRERIAELEQALDEACNALGVDGPGALKYRLDVATKVRLRVFK